MGAVLVAALVIAPGCATLDAAPSTADARDARTSVEEPAEPSSPRRSPGRRLTIRLLQVDGWADEAATTLLAADARAMSRCLTEPDAGFDASLFVHEDGSTDVWSTRGPDLETALCIERVLAARRAPPGGRRFVSFAAEPVGAPTWAPSLPGAVDGLGSARAHSREARQCHALLEDEAPGTGGMVVVRLIVDGDLGLMDARIARSEIIESAADCLFELAVDPRFLLRTPAGTVLVANREFGLWSRLSSPAHSRPPSDERSVARRAGVARDS